MPNFLEIRHFSLFSAHFRTFIPLWRLKHVSARKTVILRRNGRFRPFLRSFFPQEGRSTAHSGPLTGPEGPAVRRFAYSLAVLRTASQPLRRPGGKPPAVLASTAHPVGGPFSCRSLDRQEAPGGAVILHGPPQTVGLRSFFPQEGGVHGPLCGPFTGDESPAVRAATAQGAKPWAFQLPVSSPAGGRLEAPSFVCRSGQPRSCSRV